jgi:WD40 repeat protein
MFRRCLSLILAFMVIFMVVGCDINQKTGDMSGITNQPSVEVGEDPPQEDSSTEADVDHEDQPDVSSGQETASEAKPGLDNNDQAESGSQEQFTPTPDNRLDPEDWRNWPVTPVISGTAIDIYQKGMEAGQSPHAVSKAGDCQAIKEVLLGIYDQPDRYILAAEDDHLQDTIDNFSGSFNRDGMAVKGGFNAASVLSPMWADPDNCEPGETPLACEIRVQHPSILIISLEVWWEGRTVERYEDYMRRIIEQTIESGVVPVLSTKADNMEGDHSINLATARLAYEYDLPMWNFWRAVQNLPYQGIDPERDGFHITTEAWNVRSYTALQVIDAVWRAGQNISIASESVMQAQPTSTPEASPTPASVQLVSLPAEGEIDLGGDIGSGTIIFDLSVRNGATTSSLGVYALDIDESKFIHLAGQGNQLAAVSPEGDQIAVSRDGGLSLLPADSGHAIELTRPDAEYGWPLMYWMRDGEWIVLLGEHDGTDGIWIVSADGLVWVNLLQEQFVPSSLIPAPTKNEVYWSEGLCENGDTCTPAQNYVTEISTGKTTDFPFQFPVFSISGDYYAYANAKGEDAVGVWVANLEEPPGRFLPLPGDHLMGYEWSPDGDQLAMTTLVRSEYSGRPSDVRIFLLDPETWVQREMNPVSGLNALLTWSGDGDRLLISSSSQLDADNYAINLWVIDLEKQRTINLADSIKITSKQYISVEHIEWLP